MASPLSWPYFPHGSRNRGLMPFPEVVYCPINFKPPFAGNGRIMTTQDHFLPLRSLKNMHTFMHVTSAFSPPSASSLARRSGRPVSVVPQQFSSRACPRLAVAALFIPKTRGGVRRFHLAGQTCRRRRSPSTPSSSSPDAVDAPSSSSTAVVLPRVYPPCRGRALHAKKKRW